MLYMDGVCIGEKSETVRFGELLEKGVIVNWGRIEDTIPNFRELLERKVAAKSSGEMQIPIAGSHSPFLPVGPTRILLDCRPRSVGERDVPEESPCMARATSIRTRTRPMSKI